MKYLAYNYEESKCCYYIDEHERDDIVKDRGNRFLYCCFLNKLRCHCWVHLSKQKAINIYNKDPSFLIHACHEFTRTIKDKTSQFREYHCNFHNTLTHIDHNSFNYKVSKRKPINLQSLIIFSQDESTYYQFIFSKRNLRINTGTIYIKFG